MTRREKLLQRMRRNPGDVHFPGRGSHFVYRTGWPDNPLINVQRGAGGKAKPYQVRQVLAALERKECGQ